MDGSVSCRSVVIVTLQKVKERGNVLAGYESGLMLDDRAEGCSGSARVCKWMINGRECRWPCGSDGECDGCVRSV